MTEKNVDDGYIIDNFFFLTGNDETPDDEQDE